MVCFAVRRERHVLSFFFPAPPAQVLTMPKRRYFRIKENYKRRQYNNYRNLFDLGARMAMQPPPAADEKFKRRFRVRWFGAPLETLSNLKPIASKDLYPCSAVGPPCPGSFPEDRQARRSRACDFRQPRLPDPLREEFPADGGFLVPRNVQDPLAVWSGDQSIPGA